MTLAARRAAPQHAQHLAGGHGGLSSQQTPQLRRALGLALGQDLAAGVRRGEGARLVGVARAGRCC